MKNQNFRKFCIFFFVFFHLLRISGWSSVIVLLCKSCFQENVYYFSAFEYLTEVVQWYCIWKEKSYYFAYIILHFWQFFSWMFCCLSVQTKLKRIISGKLLFYHKSLFFLDLDYIFTTWIKKILRFKEGRAISAFYFSCFPQINILFIVLLCKL